MAIMRYASWETIAGYAVSVVLVPQQGHFVLATPAFGQPSPWPTCIKEYAFIPTFQRGIEWDVEKVEGVAESMSEVIGTTTWGRFAWGAPPYPPELVSAPPATAVFLTDGLQRFATATALLKLLDDHGFLQTGAARARLAPRLSGMWSANNTDTVRFNHHVFGNYARPTLAVEYKDFYYELEAWVKKHVADPVWIGNVERLFLDRQIGIDVYTGFASDADLARNFIALNTGGVDLGNADILRALIVEDGMNSTPPWPSSDTLAFDTAFNDAVLKQDYASRLQPLVNQILETVDVTRGVGPCRVLQAYKSGNGAQLKIETDEMLDRLGPFTDPKSPVYASCAVTEEILKCGKLPISILAAFDLLSPSPPSQPWYLSSPTLPPTEGLLVLLRAIYRLYFDEVEGRQTDLLIDILKGRHTTSLYDLANAISLRATGSKTIDQPLDRQWLAQRVEKVSQRRAARVFTACELQPAFQGGAVVMPRPAIFQPQMFGTKNAALQIDHLIPQAASGGVTASEQTIRNFAPIPKKLNAQCGHGLPWKS